MDLSTTKKRKPEENGTPITLSTTPNPNLKPEDIRKIIEPFTQEQLLEILETAVIQHIDVLDAVRSIADHDPSQRKLFIRGLGWDTATEGLRNLFSSYGELSEAIVIIDKSTGKSKGYGFVTFKHIDGALLALKEPSKKIDGRMTVTQLAATGISGSSSTNVNGNGMDVSVRKIYVGNVPFDMPADRLLSHFSSYGEIEEGPLGFDKLTGKLKGFALFVFKNVESARASLVDATKMIDGHQLVCKLAIDGKKGKTGENAGDGVGFQPPSLMPTSLTSQYATQSGLSSYGGFSAGHQGPAGMGHHSMGSQLPSSLSGYGAGLGATPISGGYGGMGTTGSSLYRLPPSSVGLPSGAYPESGHYGLSSSAFQGHHQPSGASSVPRVPAGGLYPGMPPYY